MKLPAKEPVSRRVKTLLLFSSITSCERGDTKKGISSGSSERIDDELRLHSCSPLFFFAACVESAVEVAGFDEEEEEEEEEEEDDEEEVDVLGKVGINLAFESTFNNCL
jgi:hypothetical protein